MIEQSNRLPLAQYLRLLELARDLDVKIPKAISRESVEKNIRRQLESSLPASHARVGFKSYQDLKLEAAAIRLILDTIEREIQAVASRLSPGFADDLQLEYEKKWQTVQSKLELSERLDQEYRRSREQEGEAITRRKEALLEAHQHEVGLQSVLDLAEEINKLEVAEEEMRQFRKRSAEEWAELAEGQIDVEKARVYWEKALARDNNPSLCERRDKHFAALRALEDKAACAYDDLLKEAKDLFEGATQAPLESLARPGNDLRLASETCHRIVEGLANHPYPSSTRQEADRLRVQIKDYNDRMWQHQAITYITQAEVDLAGQNLDQANQNLAHAQQALALVWDEELQSSYVAKLEAIQRRLEDKARQRVHGVIGQWRQQAQTYLDSHDAMAALKCIYAAKLLIDDTQTTQEWEALEDRALALFSQAGNGGARSLAERAKQFLAQGDGKSAFRWLQAALHLDATAILTEPDFSELTDACFETQSKRQRIENLPVQAELILAQDARDPDNMLTAERLLAEASQLSKELGETSRLPEIEARKTALQQRYREALIEELNSLLQELEQAQPQHTAATLSVLKDLTHSLAKIEKAKLTVDNVKPHLQRVFEYYAHLQSDAGFEGNLDSVEGYSLSYMLLSKVSNWEGS